MRTSFKKHFDYVLGDRKIQIAYWNGFDIFARLGRRRQTTHCQIAVDGYHAHGVAYYNPRDKWEGLPFDEAVGREFAFRRAAKALPKPLTSLVWSEYLQRMYGITASSRRRKESHA
jgi:hypothetical protein